MKSVKFKEGWLVRLDREEEVTAALETFLREEGIEAGAVSGIGGIRDAELGFFDLPSKTYRRKTVPGNLELIRYGGNITLADGKPFIHAHAVVSGPDFKAWAGHFFSARVAVTGEFILRPADWKVARRPDAFTGLHLMDLAGA